MVYTDSHHQYDSGDRPTALLSWLHQLISMHNYIYCCVHLHIIYDCLKSVSSLSSLGPEEVLAEESPELMDR